jgi:hypothetical protein
VTGIERISGPWRGYWVAAYTVEFGGLCIGYAKICLERPKSIWDNASEIVKVSYEGIHHEEAMEGVEAVARSTIARLQQMSLF